MGFGRRGSASVIVLDQHGETGAATAAAFDDVVAAVRAAVQAKIEAVRAAEMPRGILAKRITDVAAHTTVAGVPAVLVGIPSVAEPAQEMDQRLPCGPGEDCDRSTP